MTATAVQALRGRDELIRTAKAAFAKLNDPSPAFRYSIGWADDYDRLFRSQFSESTDINQLIDRAFESGRVLLCSRGGGGKTVVLRRLGRQALHKGILPVLIDLKAWTAKDYETWKASSTGPTMRLIFLLQRFSQPSVSLLELDAYPPNERKLLLVDGLNEISSGAADVILEAFSDLVRQLVQAGAIVTDRLTRRNLPEPHRWRLATIRPLARTEIDRVVGTGARNLEAGAVGANRALLETPFFLDEFLKVGQLRRTTSATLHQWFLSHASLDEPELALAAAAAFQVYSAHAGRAFSLKGFEDVAGVPVTSKLRASGNLVVTGDAAYFDHHLKHDYLASLHMALDQKLWDRQAFDVVSFHASSFETVSLVLEQLGPEKANLFVRRVYDWNPYGAAYVIAEAEYHGVTVVGRELKVVFLAMLSERKSDLLTSSAQRARDGLSLFAGPDAAPFRAAKDLDEVFALVLAVQSDEEWFLKWQTLFTTAASDHLNDSELRLIVEADSVLGWTVANVLKRVSVAADQRAWLESQLRSSSDATIRWRIVHVLGAFPTTENARFLLSVLDSDSDSWVRYGATRSLIEVAATGDQAVRLMVCDALAARAARLARDRQSLEEFTRAVFVRKERAPENWVAAIGRILEALYESATDLETKEHWLRFAYQVRAEYGA